MLDKRAAQLVIEIAKIIMNYEHVPCDSSIEVARQLAAECLRRMHRGCAAPHEDTLALLCLAFSELVLRAPKAPEEDSLNEIIRLCTRWCSGTDNGAQSGVRAMLHALLGEVYLRLHSNRAENDGKLSLAISHLRQAIELFPADADRKVVAATHHNLGSLYTTNGKFREAIDHCGAALKVLPRVENQLRWAVIQSDLGLALLSGKPDDIESGMAHLLMAIEELDRTVNAWFWAHAQHRLALAFLARSMGAEQENIEAAALCCRNALTVFVGDGFERERVSTLCTLGNALYKVAKIRDDSDLSQLLAALHEARVLATNWSPEKLGLISFDLGRAYFAQGRHRGAHDLLEAVHFHKEAIELLDGLRHSAARSIAERELAFANSFLAQLGATKNQKTNQKTGQNYFRF